MAEVYADMCCRYLQNVILFVLFSRVGDFYFFFLWMSVWVYKYICMYVVRACRCSFIQCSIQQMVAMLNGKEFSSFASELGVFVFVTWCMTIIPFAILIPLFPKLTFLYFFFFSQCHRPLFAFVWFLLSMSLFIASTHNKKKNTGKSWSNQPIPRPRFNTSQQKHYL